MKNDSSSKNDEESMSFRYSQIRFACIHAGKPRIRGEGKRPVLILPCEYTDSTQTPKLKKYTITKRIYRHNYTTSKGEFKHHTTSRKLDDTQSGDVKAPIDLQVETKNIKTYIREENGEYINSKDISNIKQEFISEREGGLTWEQLLAHALNDISI